MKPQRINSRASKLAFTRADLFVITIGVLVLTAVPAVLKYYSRPAVPEKAPRLICVNHLKQIAAAHKQFALDHADSFTFAVSTNDGGSLEFGSSDLVFEHFRPLAEYMRDPKILVCPLDVDRAPAENFGASLNSNRNVSYFVGINATEMVPGMFLAGDRHLVLHGRRLVGTHNLSTSSPVSWHTTNHGGAGNVAIVDGSAQGLSNGELRELLANTGSETNLISIPD